MISPEEIRNRAQKLWVSGAPLRAWLGAKALFPHSIRFRKPSAQEWLECFAELRSAIKRLEAGSKMRKGVGYRVVFRDVAHQKLGRLRVPDEIVFDTAEDTAACAGESAALARFAEFAQVLRSREPRLEQWLAEQPLRAMEIEATMPQLLDVVAYFQAHPRPMRYARELGIPGVDSKFIEENRALLGAWLDRLLPAQAVDDSARGLAGNGFERRFGLRHEEPLICFRWLAPTFLLPNRMAGATGTTC